MENITCPQMTVNRIQQLLPCCSIYTLLSSENICVAEKTRVKNSDVHVSDLEL